MPKTAILIDALGGLRPAIVGDGRQLAASAGRVPIVGVHRSLSTGWLRPRTAKKQKTDVVEHAQAFHHVGLLVNEPPS